MQFISCRNNASLYVYMFIITYCSYNMNMDVHTFIYICIHIHLYCLSGGLDEPLFLVSYVWLCIYCVTWSHCYCVCHIPTTKTWILAKQSLFESLWRVNVNILSCSERPISRTFDGFITVKIVFALIFFITLMESGHCFVHVMIIELLWHVKSNGLI